MELAHLEDVHLIFFYLAGKYGITQYWEKNYEIHNIFLCMAWKKNHTINLNNLILFV